MCPQVEMATRWKEEIKEKEKSETTLERALKALYLRTVASKGQTATNEACGVALAWTACQ